MLITGEYECEYCGSKIEWEYIIPQQWTHPQVQRINTKIAHPQKIGEPHKNLYLFQIRCKHCDNINNFTYYSERKL